MDKILDKQVAAIMDKQPLDRERPLDRGFPSPVSHEGSMTSQPSHIFARPVFATDVIDVSLQSLSKRIASLENDSEVIRQITGRDAEDIVSRVIEIGNVVKQYPPAQTLRHIWQQLEWLELRPNGGTPVTLEELFRSQEGNTNALKQDLSEMHKQLEIKLDQMERERYKLLEELELSKQTFLKHLEVYDRSQHFKEEVEFSKTALQSYIDSKCSDMECWRNQHISQVQVKVEALQSYLEGHVQSRSNMLTEEVTNRCMEMINLRAKEIGATLDASLSNRMKEIQMTIDNREMRHKENESAAASLDAAFTNKLKELQMQMDNREHLHKQNEIALLDRVTSQCMEIVSAKMSERTSVMDRYRAEWMEHQPKLEALQINVEKTCAGLRSAMDKMEETHRKERGELKTEVSETVSEKSAEVRAEMSTQVKNLKSLMHEKLKAEQEQRADLKATLQTMLSDAISVASEGFNSRLEAHNAEQTKQHNTMADSLARSISEQGRTLGRSINDQCASVRESLGRNISEQCDGVKEALGRSIHQQCDGIRESLGRSISEQCDCVSEKLGRSINEQCLGVRESLDRSINEQCDGVRERLGRSINEQCNALRQSKADNEKLEHLSSSQKLLQEGCNEIRSLLKKQEMDITSTIKQQEMELTSLIGDRRNQEALAQMLTAKVTDLRGLIQTSEENQQARLKRDVELLANRISGIEGPLKSLQAGRYENEVLSASVKASNDEVARVQQHCSDLFARLTEFDHGDMKVQFDLLSDSVTATNNEVARLRERFEDLLSHSSSRIHSHGVQPQSGLQAIEERGNIRVDQSNGYVTLLRPLDFEPKSCKDEPVAVFRDPVMAQAICKDLAHVSKFFNCPTTIQGYTKGGEGDFWQTLATRRAAAVAEMMVDFGAHPNSLRVQGLPGRLGRNAVSTEVYLQLDNREAESGSGYTGSYPYLDFAETSMPSSWVATYPPQRPQRPQSAPPGPRSPQKFRPSTRYKEYLSPAILPPHRIYR